MTETIAPPTAKPINHWIGGKSVPGTSGRSGPVWNPATGEQSGAVDFATVEEIDAAVQAAKEAFTDLARRLALPPRRALLQDPRSSSTSTARTSRGSSRSSTARSSPTRSARSPAASR